MYAQRFQELAWDSLQQSGLAGDTDAGYYFNDLYVQNVSISNGYHVTSNKGTRKTNVTITYHLAGWRDDVVA